MGGESFMTELTTWLQANIVPIAGIISAIGIIYKTCGKPVQDLVKKIDRIDEDTADLIWDRLQQGHDFYCTRGWASASDKERMCLMYKRYKQKGRNHLAESFERDILALPMAPNDDIGR